MMIKTKMMILGLILMISHLVNAQIPFPHNATSGGSSIAERVSNFGVSGVSLERFEITNATVENNRFLPALWAHSSLDNNHVLQIHGTTIRRFDTGSQPLVKFIASVPTTLNLNAPSGTQFPWGNGGTQQTVNTRPTFAWINGSSTVMLLSAQNNLGIGTTAPSARLHTNGTVRMQNLPNTSNPTFLLGTDASGNVRELDPDIIGGGGGLTLNCLSTTGVDNTNKLTKITSTGNLTCSQVYDNGTRVGIGTTSPLHKLSVNGNVHSMTNTFISDKQFKKNIQDIKNPLSTILSLTGKTYNWRVDEFTQYEFTDRNQIGFIAQEVREVLPELVHVDKNGEHSMNYTAIIPVLVEAIKEQQNQISLLQNQLSDMENIDKKENIIQSDRSSFSTNYPNPFSSTTTIDYFISKTVNTARIIIYSSNGTTISSFELEERGMPSQLVINKKNLQEGIYFYTMLTDDVVIGTKKMMVK